MRRCVLFLALFCAAARGEQQLSPEFILAQNEARIDEFKNVQFDYTYAWRSRGGLAEHSGKVIRSGRLWRQTFVALDRNLPCAIVEGTHYHFLREGPPEGHPTWAINYLGKPDENGEVSGRAKTLTGYNRLPDVTKLVRERLYDMTIKAIPQTMVDEGNGLIKLVGIDGHLSFTIDTKKDFYPVKMTIAGGTFEVELQQVAGHWLPAKYTETTPGFTQRISVSNVQFPEQVDPNLFTYESLGMPDNEVIHVVDAAGEEETMKLVQLRLIPTTAYPPIRAVAKRAKVPQYQEIPQASVVSRPESNRPIWIGIAWLMAVLLAGAWVVGLYRRSQRRGI